MKQVKRIYHKVKYIKNLFIKVNWIKTVYFNFKMFPYEIAVKLPVFFYGKVKFQSLKGSVQIDSPIERGMIGFGKKFEKQSVSKGISEVCVKGKIVFKGRALFGKDYFIYVEKDAILQIGSMSGMGSNTKLICMNKIILGDHVRISYETQLMDSNFHQMFDTETGERFPIKGIINIGDFNFIGNRVTVLPNTMTNQNVTIASNSLCNNNYFELGQFILLGGIPAKLIRKNFSRDWESEKNQNFLDIWFKI